jgi:hypothetical protein
MAPPASRLVGEAAAQAGLAERVAVAALHGPQGACARSRLGAQGGAAGALV